NPPFRTNQLLVHHKDFLVMILRGPNTRLDFHIEPGDEFFYQVEGEMELVLKPHGERRQSVRIKEGEIFVCPGGLPHSPRRFENTWGLVIERKRRQEEKEEFAWFCENCDDLVLSRVVNQQLIGPKRRVEEMPVVSDPVFQMIGRKEVHGTLASSSPRRTRRSRSSDLKNFFCAFCVLCGQSS
ncbi:MAG TPA: cupin domain-containing protein, partial [Candidatus Binatia bacterium]